MRFLIVASAVVCDLIFGDPYWFAHPVKLMGKLIAFEETFIRKFVFSKHGLKLAGLFVVIFNMTLGFFIPFFIMRFLRPFPVFYFCANVIFCYTCLACKCLYLEAMKVLSALKKDLNSARKQLSNIVGRDTSNLSKEAVLMAVTETVAENTSDGVIAPLFFMFIGGVPLAFVYKFINTMDSMLGYKNEKYCDFGFFPAKTDDIANYIPARLCAFFMILSSPLKFNAKNGFRILLRDSKKHSSPNAGFPESAVAGLLGVRLGGANYYGGKLVEKPFIGDPLKPISEADVHSACKIMFRAELLALLVFALTGFLLTALLSL